MTVTIDPSSIKITVHAEGVKPVVAVHKTPLTLGGSTYPGYVRVELSHTKAKLTMKDAFDADGQVRFKLGAGGDTLNDWKVGFVQIARQNTCRTVYAGRIPSEGSINCDGNGLLTSPVLLDCSDSTYVPFFNAPVGSSVLKFKGLVAQPNAGDGPYTDVPISMANEAVSKVDNFLWQYNQDTEFWTVLTVMDPTKALQFLAHYHWRVVNELAVTWLGGEPFPSLGGASSFKILEAFVAGQPTDPAVARILSSPTGPLANDVFIPAFNNSLIFGTGTNPVIHRESNVRDFSIPDFFWR
jgi:hypothetical protein